MKKIVIYKSKTGFTKRYAEWIAEEIGCSCVSVKEITANSLESYQTVIYGGGITAGSIGGLKKIKTMMAGFPDKKFIVFATGATPVEVYKDKDQIRDANFTEEEKQRIPYFYFVSGINYDNMKLGGKLLMKLFRSMLSKKKDMTPEEQGMADTIKHSVDHTDKKYITPLIQCVKS